MKGPRLLHNIAALGTLQGVNYALMLATIPYLTRVFGVETWGRIVFVQLIINYLVWFTNWGFYLSATRKIAALRDRADALSDVYMATWSAQWLLTSAGLLVFFCVVPFVPILKKDLLLYFWGAGLVVGNLLMPLWFLNGLELIREAAIIQILTKALTIPPILILVKTRNDAGIYIGINSGCTLLVGIFTILWLKATFPSTWSIPKWRRVLEELREGSILFVSNLWANLNSALIPTALGVLAGPTQLGYYNLADRARGAAVTILHPITHSLFPRMCNLFAGDSTEAARLLRRSGTALLSTSILISLGFALFARPILAILGGNDFSSAAGLLRWLSPTIFITTLCEFLIYQIVIPTERYDIFHKTLLMTLFLTILTAYPLITRLKAEGAVLLSLVTCSFLTGAILVYLFRHAFFNLSNTIDRGKNNDTRRAAILEN